MIRKAFDVDPIILPVDVNGVNNIIAHHGRFGAQTGDGDLVKITAALRNISQMRFFTIVDPKSCMNVE